MSAFMRHTYRSSRRSSAKRCSENEETRERQTEKGVAARRQVRKGDVRGGGRAGREKRNNDPPREVLAGKW